MERPSHSYFHQRLLPLLIYRPTLYGIMSRCTLTSLPGFEPLANSPVDNFAFPVHFLPCPYPFLSLLVCSVPHTSNTFCLMPAFCPVLHLTSCSLASHSSLTYILLPLPRFSVIAKMSFRVWSEFFSHTRSLCSCRDAMGRNHQSQGHCQAKTLFVNVYL